MTSFRADCYKKLEKILKNGLTHIMGLKYFIKKLCYIGKGFKQKRILNKNYV
jgi:hypothetical protein